MTVGPRVSEVTAELFAKDAYRDYLELHGLSVQLTEALAEFWHARIREELGFGAETSDDLSEVLAHQAYRGSRYSFGYPACPDLEDRRKDRRPARPGADRRHAVRGLPARARAGDRRDRRASPRGEVLQRAVTVPSRAAAVLFDMDGLLIDSEPLWTIAEIELAESLGGNWGDDIKTAIIGTRLDVAVPTILKWYDVDSGPVESRPNAMAFLLGRMVELFHDRLPLMPGALDLVDGVRALGVPTALVSSSYRALVDAALDSLGRARFDATVAGDEVGEGKPSPEPYLRGCELLGVEPARCVIVEDAMSGIESGEAAGATVVAVPWIAPDRGSRPAAQSSPPWSWSTRRGWSGRY